MRRLKPAWIFGEVDILVNNAGLYRAYNLHGMSEKDWNKITNVNLKSVPLGSKRVISKTED